MEFDKTFIIIVVLVATYSQGLNVIWFKVILEKVLLGNGLKFCWSDILTYQNNIAAFSILIFNTVCPLSMCGMTGS